MSHPRGLFPISIITISFNEETHISRAIESALWAKEHIVVDSGSTDKTVAVAQELGAKTILQRWLGYGQQKNFAAHHATQEWILFLDADEALTPELSKEIQELISDPQNVYAGASMPRKTWFLGRWIMHGGWYPNRLVRLCKKGQGEWTTPQVHETLLIQGKVAALKNQIHHWTFEHIEDQVLGNIRYARLGAQALQAAGRRSGICTALLKAHWKFVHAYILQRGFLDGWAGLVIAINAAHSMYLKYLFLAESLRQPTSGPQESQKS